MRLSVGERWRHNADLHVRGIQDALVVLRPLPPRPDVRPPHLAADHRAPRRLRTEHRDRPARARREWRHARVARRRRRSGSRAALLLASRAASRRRALDDGRARLQYAAAYPTRGVVVVDNGPDIRPFAELVRRLGPALRGPGFTRVWQTFEQSLGLERISEAGALARSRHPPGETRSRRRLLGAAACRRSSRVPNVDRRGDPPEARRPLPRRIRAVDHRRERERFKRLPDVQLEQWTGDGHFVHLVDPHRFASRLRRFIDHCAGS
jgi:hypothetical protein